MSGVGAIHVFSYLSLKKSFEFPELLSWQTFLMFEFSSLSGLLLWPWLLECGENGLPAQGMKQSYLAGPLGGMDVFVSRCFAHLETVM